MKRSYFGASGGYLAPLGPRFAAERWPNRSPAEPDTPKKMWGYPMRARRPICVVMHSSHHHHHHHHQHHHHHHHRNIIYHNSCFVYHIIRARSCKAVRYSFSSSSFATKSVTRSLGTPSLCRKSRVCSRMKGRDDSLKRFFRVTYQENPVG